MSDAKLTRGETNNNPGNLDYHSGIDWLGQTGCELHVGARFATFDTAEHGIRAIAKLVHTYQLKHDLNTVRGIISRWAPPNENSTGAYVNFVANALQCDPDIPIDTSNPAVLARLVTAIIKQENGRCNYPQDIVLSAVNSALT